MGLGINEGIEADDFVVVDNLIRAAPGVRRLAVGIRLGVTRHSIIRNVIEHVNTGMDIYESAGLMRGNTLLDGTGSGMIVSVGGFDIARNRVHGFAGSGIKLVSYGGTVVGHNDFRGNGGVDCVSDPDDTTTVWIDNLGNESQPEGLCEPVP